ncbi:PREDICTED: uncharacterized protein LOC105449710 [Wasmannia auropunctata]|uniref:uncharacterized protein LOC105449710 n=1 Tax=Wasmannia auropunctata TaxID=64793 RepID=UPI0005EF598B|nr:PREDICTED: uncharacterized protein LOC105449710 [Wasmannia auropunctata]
MTTIRKNQQEIKGKIDALVATNNNIRINKFSHLLPITSLESFNEIDNSLANSQEDFASLIKYLNFASGDTVNQLVPSVMKIIMKKTVSIHFSGCGKKKKLDFSATKIAAAVFEIVSRKLPNATRDETFKKMSKFLAESGDREGGRKNRSNSSAN